MNRVSHLEKIADDLEDSILQETSSWIKSVKETVKRWFQWIPDTWTWLKSVIRTGIYVIVIIIVLGVAIKCLQCLKYLSKLYNCCKYQVSAKEHIGMQQYRKGSVVDMV